MFLLILKSWTTKKEQNALLEDTWKSLTLGGWSFRLTAHMMPGFCLRTNLANVQKPSCANFWKTKPWGDGLKRIFDAMGLWREKLWIPKYFLNWACIVWRMFNHQVLGEFIRGRWDWDPWNVRMDKSSSEYSSISIQSGWPQQKRPKHKATQENLLFQLDLTCCSPPQIIY